MQAIEYGNFHIIRLPEKLTVDNAIAAYLEVKNLLTSEKKRKFVLVFSKVSDVDASGLAGIISAAAWARGKGHQVWLCAPTPQVQQQLHEQDVSGFFPFIENEYDLLSRLPD